MHRMFAMATRHPQQAIRLKYCSEKSVYYLMNYSLVYSPGLQVYECGSSDYL